MDTWHAMGFYEIPLLLNELHDRSYIAKQIWSEFLTLHQSIVMTSDISVEMWSEYHSNIKFAMRRELAGGVHILLRKTYSMTRIRNTITVSLSSASSEPYSILIRSLRPSSYSPFRCLLSSRNGVAITGVSHCGLKFSCRSRGTLCDDVAKRWNPHTNQPSSTSRTMTTTRAIEGRLCWLLHLPFFRQHPRWCGHLNHQAQPPHNRLPTWTLLHRGLWCPNHDV